MKRLRVKKNKSSSIGEDNSNPTIVRHQCPFHDSIPSEFLEAGGGSRVRNSPGRHPRPGTVAENRKKTRISAANTSDLAVVAQPDFLCLVDNRQLQKIISG